MSFVEMNLFGVYVAPISLMLLGSFGMLLICRKLLISLGWFEHIWHPALFEFALFMIILSAMVFIIAGVRPYA